MNLALEAEIELCRRSKQYLFERHYRIKDTNGNLRLMNPLRLGQRKALAVLNWCRSLGKPIRLIIGKSRKHGMSSFFCADVLDEVLRHAYDALIIAHDQKTSEYLLGICQRFYENLDLPKPGLRKGLTNKYEIRFEGHEGRIDIETANNVKAGTGRTPQYIFPSEGSKWEKGFETIIALLQSVGNGPNTAIVWESTFYGEDAVFLPLWQDAYNNSRLTFDDKLNVDFEVIRPGDWNGYIPLFISSLEHEEATIELSDDGERDRLFQTLDPYEQMLVERYAARPEYLKWRRFTLKHKTANNLAEFKQEYPVTPQEAVKSTGRARFDVDLLDQMPVDENPRIGFLSREDRWDRPIKFKRDNGERLHLFKEPFKGHRYVIGVDTAEGMMDEFGKDPDASCAIVLDLNAGGEQAATLWGQEISEESIVAPLKLLAEWYNMAYVVIETNSTGKHVAIEMNKIYPQGKLYHKMDESTGRVRMSHTLGWRTHVGTRNLLIVRLASAISEQAILLHDKRTIMELKRFVWGKSGRVDAKAGYHDDHVFALGLCVIGMEAYPYKTAPEDQEAANRAYQFQNRFRQSTASRVTGY